MGFDRERLETGVRKHIEDGWETRTVKPAGYPGETNRIEIVGPMTGLTGATSEVLSVWGLLEDGSVVFIIGHKVD